MTTAIADVAMVTRENNEVAPVIVHERYPIN